MSSKASVLEMLEGRLCQAQILPQVSFMFSTWRNDRSYCCEKIAKLSDSVIVRSSCDMEDLPDASMAGKFKSILFVDSKCEASLAVAVEEVFESFGDDKSIGKVFVQPMIEKSKISGVILSADLQTLAPYYTINFISGSDTTAVTSGKQSETIFCLHSASDKRLNGWKKKLILTVNEIQRLLENPYIDVEFAFGQDDTLYILQVRPIVRKAPKELTDVEIDIALNNLHKKINKLSQSHHNVLGKKALYGVMPDWNPAEIIGLNPGRLALSLYKELVTDTIWAYQRHNYGYRNLISHPLMHSFLGVPYIDVRISFNSFIPKLLEDEIAEKLVNYYTDELIQAPYNHDKIEFEIVFSCYDLSTPERLKKLTSHGFNANELKRIEFCLLELTNTFFSKARSPYKQDLEKINELSKRYEAVVDSELSLVDKIYWLIEDCKMYGTLPFAGIARVAFVAMQLLNSMVNMAVISSGEKELFLNSLQTVSKELAAEMALYHEGNKTKEEMVEKYGHLRAGSYNILSQRYDEAFDDFFDTHNNRIEKYEGIFRFEPHTIEALDKLLQQHGLKINATSLFEFIKNALEAREFAKFSFTKHLSEVLRVVENFGTRIQVHKRDLFHVDIRVLLSLYSSLNGKEAKRIVEDSIRFNQEEYKLTRSVKLPILVTDPDEIYCFNLEESRPNFITSKVIRGGVVEEPPGSGIALKGKIVFIKSADPGYDYLFSKDIAGLATCYGGVNSHMAIRCFELGIPAIIGIGEGKFEQWLSWKTIEIDCLNMVVKKI